jgi:hypothetical protein
MIYDLSDEACGEILNLLDIQHQTRLYATGDRRLQTWLLSCSHRCFDFGTSSSMAHSDLVCNLLIPYAERAKARTDFLEKSVIFERVSGSHPSRLKELTLVGTIGTFTNVLLDRTRAEKRDLTRLHKLESLSFTDSQYVDFDLPVTLTCLRMQDCALDHAVNFDQLVNLVELESSASGERLSMLEEYKWPPKLTSLSLRTSKYNEQVATFEQQLGLLPPNLRHLRLADSGYRRVIEPFDIMPPAVCTTLESFEIDAVECVLKDGSRRFPPSLKRLVVKNVRVWSSNSHAEAVIQALEESSLTYLSLDRFLADDDESLVMDGTRVGQWQDAMLSILPRLENRSLEIVSIAMFRSPFCKDAFPESQVRQIFVEHGYCEHFFDFVKCAHEVDHDALFKSSAKCTDQREVRRYIRDHGLRQGVVMTYPPDRGLALTKWMLQNNLDPEVVAFYLPHLGTELRHRVTKLILTTVPDELSKWQFDGVHTIFIETTRVDECIVKLVENRHRFPSLQSFRVPTRYAMTTKDADLLKEMRLYGRYTIGKYLFDYRVAPPRIE